MMNKGLKKTFLIILFSLIAINVVTLSGFSTEGKTKVNYANNAQPQQLQIKLNNGNIVLIADLDSQYREYRNFRIKIGNIEKRFNWRSIGSISFAPSMRLIDLGNDKNAGVAIFLVESQGTGVFIENVHVIKIDEFKEIPVESPLSIIQKHVKTQSTNDSIIIDIDGNKVVLDKSYLNKLGISNPVQKLVYEYHIVYGTQNNSLFAEVGVSNENLTYIGNFHIDYTYKDEMLTMLRINFQKF
jgi:hypothetical protein